MKKIILFIIIILSNSVFLFANDFSDIMDIFNSTANNRYVKLRKAISNYNSRINYLQNVIYKEAKALKSNSISINSKFNIALEILEYYNRGSLSGEFLFNNLMLEINEKEFLHLNKPAIYRYPIAHFLSITPKYNLSNLNSFLIHNIIDKNLNEKIDEKKFKMYCRCLIQKNGKYNSLYIYDKLIKIYKSSYDEINKHPDKYKGKINTKQFVKRKLELKFFKHVKKTINELPNSNSKLFWVANEKNLKLK